jgi:GTPase
MLGTKLSIVTHKPQTTRKRVLGIYTNDNIQVIFFDNPGIIEPKYELHRSMMNFVAESLTEADIIIYLIDIKEYIISGSSDNFQLSDEFKHFKQLNKPKIAVLNKVDLLKNIKETLPVIKNLSESGFFDEIVPISALKKLSIDELIKVIAKYLPLSPFYYDAETLSTQPQRFFVSELIRENVFLKFHEEVPYSTEINITEFKERQQGKWFISAEIIVERPSQKAILIGEKGTKIKSLGEAARKAIEEHLDIPVFLELFVKVRDKWRNDKNLLHSYGY